MEHMLAWTSQAQVPSNHSDHHGRQRALQGPLVKGLPQPRVRARVRVCRTRLLGPAARKQVEPGSSVRPLGGGPARRRTELSDHRTRKDRGRGHRVRGGVEVGICPQRDRTFAACAPERPSSKCPSLSPSRPSTPCAAAASAVGGLGWARWRGVRPYS